MIMHDAVGEPPGTGRQAAYKMYGPCAWSTGPACFMNQLAAPEIRT